MTISQRSKGQIFTCGVIILSFVLGAVFSSYFLKTSARRSGGYPPGTFETVFSSGFLLMDFDVRGFDVVYPDVPIHSNRDRPGQTTLSNQIAINVNNDIVTLNYKDHEPIVINWLQALEQYEKDRSGGALPRPLEIKAQSTDIQIRFYIYNIIMLLNEDGSRRLGDMKGMLLIDFDSPPDSQSGSAH